MTESSPTVIPVGFVDIETTGLSPRLHDVYEVGLLVPMPDGSWNRLRWFLPVDLSMADPIALEVGKFHERHPQGYGSLCDEPDLTPLREFAAEFAHVTHGLHLVAAMPHFDMPRLLDIILDAGLINGWNYHCICIESLMIGYLAAIEDNGTVKPGAITFPWKSDDLYKALGLDLTKYLRHTAMGDCDLAKAAWDVIFPSTPLVRNPVEKVDTPDSSALEYIAYNRDTCDLMISFKRGSINPLEWIYQAVPEWVWMEGKRAESKGGWFANMVKGKYLSYRSDDPLGGVTQWDTLCGEVFQLSGFGFDSDPPRRPPSDGITSVCKRRVNHPHKIIDGIGHSDVAHLRGR